ncbi:histidinol dehydrogenase [Acinetobacter sp. c3-l95]|uniref:histidinol dehydrogenase n=1 Tax=Acinetobacter sp. c3-l95 TaxID=3342804 RepID=UPI0035BA274A
MRIYDWNSLNAEQRNQLLQRPAQMIGESITERVNSIRQNVLANGDNALLDYAKQFDGVSLDHLKVSQDAITQAKNHLPDELKQAIKQAYANIFALHQAQKPVDVDVETQAGIRCQVLSRPLERVGLYIPGGSAPLFSTVLMLGTPAKIAGCDKVVLCSPAPICDEILYTAELCGIDDIYSVGGAGAVFAMAYGTDTIPQVDKIFGPGNSYVTEAKRQVSMTGTAIDMPAGPSEVLVISDEFADADFVASDLLSQAEHGADSQAVLVTSSKALAEQVALRAVQLGEQLPRFDTIKQSLNHSHIIIAEDIASCIAISNAYAPEHLIINTQNPRQYLNDIRHAGSVFLGAYSPESMGDYASGTNHVLPTYGYARTHSSLGLADFYKRMTVQELTSDGFASLAPSVACMAQAEQLDAHKLAVTLRMDSLKG